HPAGANRAGPLLAVPLYLALMAERATFRVKRGLAEMLKGGVIMDVTTPEQARIAEDAGAVAVMALERVPADIRAEGGVARMARRAPATSSRRCATSGRSSAESGALGRLGARS